MSGYRRRGAVAVGTLAILTALGIRVTTPASRPSDGLAAVVGLVALAGIVGALWKLVGSVDDRDVAPPPWTDSGALFETAPERSRSDLALSGLGLVGAIRTAGGTAREEESVEDGLAVVRPELRAVLVAALVQGGADRAAVEASLAEGSWTDDRLAASVLDEDVVPPDRSLRRRAEAWLFPERAVVRRTARAVQAVAEAADDALPAVVGQRAPRSVPVLPPTLEDLQRGADGSLRPAVDAPAVARGPGPTRPGDGRSGDGDDTSSETDDASGETDGTGGETAVSGR